MSTTPAELSPIHRIAFVGNALVVAFLAMLLAHGRLFVPTAACAAAGRP